MVPLIKFNNELVSKWPCSLLSTPGGIPIPSFLEGVFQRMGRPPQSPGEHERDSRGGERHRAVHQQPRLPRLREQPQDGVGPPESAHDQDPSQDCHVSVVSIIYCNGLLTDAVVKHRLPFDDMEIRFASPLIAYSNSQLISMWKASLSRKTYPTFEYEEG